MEFYRVAPDPESPHEAYAKVKPEILDGCIMCKNPGELVCGSCKSRYCSQACQKKDWRHHRMLFRSSMNPPHNISVRPGPHYHRIIVFSTNKTQPTWDWACFEDTTSGFSVDESIRLLGPPTDEYVHASAVCNHSLANNHLRFGRGLSKYTLVKRDNEGSASEPGLEFNRAVLGLAKPGHILPEFGPVVFVAYSSNEVGRLLIGVPVKWEDATLKDLRLIVDLYLTNPGNPCIEDPDRHGLSPDLEIWPAVKVNCKEDMARFDIQPEDTIESIFVSSSTADLLKAHLPSVLGLSWVWGYATTNSTLQGPRENIETRFDIPDLPDGFPTEEVMA